MESNEEIDLFAYHDGFEKYRDIKSQLIFDGCMKEKPQVSIMIPTFHRPELLREAIESALAQKTDIPFEVVVVDNECAQEIGINVNDVVSSFNAPNLKLYRNEKNIGMFGNWNRCIEKATADCITILSDDDMLKEDWLNKVYFAERCQRMIIPECQVIRTQETKKKISNVIKNIVSKDSEDSVKLLTIRDIITGNPGYGMLGIMFSKSVALNLGGFNERYYPSADYEFIARYMLNYQAYKFNFPLAIQRILVNESLNPTTKDGFINVDKIIRFKIISSLNVGFRIKELLHCYSLMYAKATMLHMASSDSIYSNYLADRINNQSFSMTTIFFYKLTSFKYIKFVYKTWYYLIKFIWRFFLIFNKKMDTMI